RSVDALAHELVIECAPALGCINAGQPARDFTRTGDGDVIPALLPQQEFQQALDVHPVELAVFRGVRKDTRLEEGDVAIWPLQRQSQRVAVRAHALAVRAIP